MPSGRMLRTALRYVAAAIAATSFGTFAIAQDSDPNSPTPVFLSMEGSARPIAYPALKSRRYSLSRPVREVFRPDTKIVLFVTNVDLMEDEGANAFRVYAEDEKGRTYRFPVLDLSPAADQPGVYALTTLLRDEIGYWPQPEANGDLKVFIAWRGLASNRLKLGFGSTGGRFEKDTSIKPSPLSQALAGGKSNSSQIALPDQDAVGYFWAGDRTRFLEQAAFGPTPALDFRLRRIGIRTWLAEQFLEPYPSATNP